MMNINSAIIKGPRKEILQDAISLTNKQAFNLFVVADGLGSSKNSDFGSKKATLAVEKSIFQWRKLEKNDPKVLIQLIYFYWNLFIRDSDYEKKDCLTTCLFAYVDKISKKIMLGQLGDGLILFKSKRGTVTVKSNEDFNFTKSLGSSKSFSDWTIKSFDFNIHDFTLLITTDGISEDLFENKEDEFAEALLEKMSKIKRNKRNNYLCHILENWPTKFHSDDKTICIVWGKKK